MTLAEFKRALAANYGRGVSPEEAQRVTVEVVKNLKAAGKPVGEEQIAAVLAQVLAGSVSPEDKKRYDELLELIEAVPKF